MSVATGRRFVLALGIGGVALSVGVTWKPILGVVGALLAIAVLVFQYRSAGPAAFDFVESDWVAAGDEYEYLVPRTHHGRRTPEVSVFRETSGGFEAIVCDIETNAKGDVRISIAAHPFRGQVRIA